MPRNKQWKIEILKRNLREAEKRLPKILTNMAQTHFEDSFRNQGFTDAGLKKWQPRKPNAKRNSGRAILVDRGILRGGFRSIHASKHNMRVVNNVPYASFHNSGIFGRLPKRQFMGNSQKLERRSTLRMIRELNRATKRTF